MPCMLQKTNFCLKVIQEANITPHEGSPFVRNEHLNDLNDFDNERSKSFQFIYRINRMLHK